MFCTLKKCKTTRRHGIAAGEGRGLSFSRWRRTMTGGARTRVLPNCARAWAAHYGAWPNDIRCRRTKKMVAQEATTVKEAHCLIRNLSEIDSLPHQEI
jgi:hypothetical protein